jgi:hypothetical protein
MWILPFVGYMGLAIGFCFLTLAIGMPRPERNVPFAANKLYQRLDSIIYPNLSKSIPSLPNAFSRVSYTSSSVSKHSSVSFVLLNHYVWFSHFSNVSVPPQQSIYDKPNVPTFTEIASYFGICVWLVPFSLFVSLSAGDNVLPTMGSEEPTTPSAAPVRNKRQGMVKVVVDTALEWIGELGKLAGWWRPERGF